MTKQDTSFLDDNLEDEKKPDILDEPLNPQEKPEGQPEEEEEKVEENIPTKFPSIPPTKGAKPPRTDPLARVNMNVAAAKEQEKLEKLC